MHNFRLSPLTLVLALSALTSSCWPGKSPKPFTPPPPQTQPEIPTNAPIVTGQPPQIAGDPSASIPQTPTTSPELAAPPAPKPVPPRRNPQPPPQRTNPTTPPVETPPVTRLGQSYTPDELRQYTRSIEDSMGRARRALDALAQKRLNGDQQGEVNRITTFLKQAEQARDAQDLLTAVSLAQRADTLAQDLLGRIQ
jgi:hypothetical protein